MNFIARVSSPDLATILSLAKRRVELNGWNWVSSVTDIHKDMWRLGCIKRPSLLLSRIKWTAQVSRQVGAEPRLPPRLITGNVMPSRRASAASNWGFPSDAEKNTEGRIICGLDLHVGPGTACPSLSRARSPQHPTLASNTMPERRQRHFGLRARCGACADAVFRYDEVIACARGPHRLRPSSFLTWPWASASSWRCNYRHPALSLPAAGERHDKGRQV